MSRPGEADEPSNDPTAADPPNPRRWLMLWVLVVAQFIVILDAVVVTVALPSIQDGLSFSTSGLQWVVNAYLITFAGFLLLGGRFADLIGRRRVFAAGVVVFTFASLAAGLAQETWQLIAARAVQGFGAALLSPAALSIVIATFRDERERNTALGVWGGIAGAAGGFGMVAGGLLTQGAGWEWIFFVNVPVGAGLLAAMRIIPAGRPERPGGSFDIAGGMFATVGIAGLVLGVFMAERNGWSDPTSFGLIVAAGLTLLAFVMVERRTPNPLVPLTIFRLKTVSVANSISLLLGAALISFFFFVPLFLGRVMGYDPIEIGVAFLPLEVALVTGSVVATRLINRFGYVWVMVGGLLTSAAGLLWFTMVPADAGYAADVLGPLVLFGAGLGVAFVATYIICQDGVPASLAGLASGLINTSQNVGGAVGLAALGAMAAARTEAEHGQPFEAALTLGLHVGWAGAAVCLIAAAGLTTLLVRHRSNRTATVPVAPEVESRR